jgi:hypothetical protein
MGTHWMIFLTMGNLIFPPSSPSPTPSKQEFYPFSATQAGGPLSRSRHLRDKMFTHRRASVTRAANGLGDPRFCWSRDRFVAQLSFGSNPVLDIFSVFAASLKIQFMSPASDLFSQWFSESNHCNLLGCQDGAGAPTELRM